MSIIEEKHSSDILVFEPFIRTKFPVLICLFGFSGCGKTKSAIKIAQGLGGKTMFLDTETGRGRVYAQDAVGFQYSELTPPFTPERYIAAIKQVERGGFDNLIIDSGSHEWDGLGGMIEIADARVDKNGRPIQGKAKWSVKSRHKTFINTMMAGRMNIIICLRAKDRYVKRIVDNREVEIIEGFVPLQERNFKYDMMIQLPMPEGGRGQYLMDETKGFKCPGELLPFFNEGDKVSETIGAKIAEWVKTGAPVDEVLRQLKIEAMGHAEEGVAHFRAYWATLPVEIRLKLKPFIANFESAATTADVEREMDDAGDSPIALNSVGTNINSLKIGLPSGVRSLGVKVDAKEPATPSDRILDSFGIKRNESRREEDADWWAIFDDIKSQLENCNTVNQVNACVLDNEASIASLVDKAPEDVYKAYEKVALDVREFFNKTQKGQMP